MEDIPKGSVYWVWGDCIPVKGYEAK